MSRGKRIAFAAVAVGLFFAFAEAVLWGAGVRTLLEERDPFLGFSRHVRAFEPDPARGVMRTPPRALAHSFNYQEFALEKPPNAFRAFVIGGSSAFGFPFGADVAFARVLGEALRAAVPDRPIETINAGAMSYGSHRLRILVHEILEYDLDLLVVYGGHNEFVERGFYAERLRGAARLDGLRAKLVHSRLYSVMARGLERLGRRDSTPPPADADAGSLLGLDVDRQVAADVEMAEKVHAAETFRENLLAIVAAARAAGVPVILCTVPSNTAAWKPNAALFSADLDVAARAEATRQLEEGERLLDEGHSAGAIAVLESARGIAPEHAAIRFRLGQAYRSAERWDEARTEFAAARDRDGKPARAPGAMLEAIRDVATDAPGATLVDVELGFEDAVPHGLLGFNLFEDYVHPNPAGHRLIAWLLFDSILRSGLVGAPSEADRALFAEAVGGDAYDLDADAAAPSGLADARTPNLLYNLAVVLENQGHTDQAIARYRDCLDLNPEYWLARENLARLLFARGAFAEAAADYGTVVLERPDRLEPRLGYAEALRRLGRPAEALRVLEEASALHPRAPRAWSSLGGTLAQLERHAEAEAAFRRALDLDPESAEAWSNLGFALLFQNRLDAADVAFAASLKLRPHDRRARNGLAAVLTERGDLDGAERIFRENLDLDAGDSFARGGLEAIRRRRGQGAPER